MTRFLYAAYGSNLHPARISARLKSPELVGTSYLADRGFRCHKKSKDGSGKGNIVRAREGVYVAIYELNSCDKKSLDQIEGLGVGYDEEVLNVRGFGNCLAYVATESAINDDLLPYQWYKQLILLGCKYHGFPGEYVAKMSSLAETTDHDTERRALNMKLVERIEHGI